MKILNIFFLICLLIFSSACTNYLDIVPDNIPTVDHAFNNKQEAERFLFGCFSFLPAFLDINSNPSLVSGGEVWLIDDIQGIGSPRLWYVAKGDLGTQEPLAAYWSSKMSKDPRGGKRLFTALRDCNIFLENIDKPFDLTNEEKERWIAEVKFLKAFYHFWLFRMYGPIPLIKENLPISASPDEVLVYREPIDEVVEYIVELLDESVKDLPIEVIPFDMGRPTKAIALAIKAQVLTYAASPLFNGNTDYADMIDNRGIQLFPQEFKLEKWQRAAEALKIAIDTCHSSGHYLYDFHTSPFSTKLNESTILAQQVRAAVTELWNKEIIWGDSRNSPNTLQQLCHPGFFSVHGEGAVLPVMAPPINIVKQFYTNHGIPIEEDVNWDNINLYEFRTGDNENRFYIKEGYTTINLHFNREPRFYGSISFDGGMFYGNGRINSDDNLLHTEFIYGGSGVFAGDRYSSTGYLVKKLIHILTSIPDNTTGSSYYRYAFPIIRLADLYLMYAEALNEMKPSPDAEVYEYIDFVRERSGLEGVLDSWSKYSKFPEKPSSQAGMRDIIHRERLNELAFEGSRFWDLKRWKLAEEYMNQPIQGWNIFGEKPQEFYELQTLFQLRFEKKDYLWPIIQDELIKNKNLLQNPNW